MDESVSEQCVMIVGLRALNDERMVLIVVIFGDSTTMLLVNCPHLSTSPACVEAQDEEDQEALRIYR